MLWLWWFEIEIGIFGQIGGYGNGMLLCDGWVCNEILGLFVKYLYYEIVVLQWGWVNVNCDVDFFIDYVDDLIGCFEMDDDVWVECYEFF